MTQIAEQPIDGLGASEETAMAAAGVAAGQAIGYVVSRFPKLTETFVLNEIVEMQRLGARVAIYPLFRHRDAVTQPRVAGVLPCVHVVRRASLAVARAHAHYLRRRPGAYLHALWEALRGTRASARYFAGAVVCFPLAVWCAYDAERRQLAHLHAQFANHPALVALIVHRLTRIPFSFTARGSDIHVDRTMLSEKVAAARFAIAVSAFNRDVLVKAGGQGAGGKIHVVYGGIDTDRFRPGPGRDGGAPLRIVCVARFEEVKGHRQLVEACRVLNGRGVTFECHLFGDGGLRPRIERQIATAGLSDLVRVHGACTETQIVDALSAATVFVLATVPAANGKREGIPNVLKEAMACGLPVVASRMSGIPELVEDSVSGLLVAPNDIAGLADALQRLDADRQLCARLGQAARARIVGEFDLRASTRKRAALFFSEAANASGQA